MVGVTFGVVPISRTVQRIYVSTSDVIGTGFGLDEGFRISAVFGVSVTRVASTFLGFSFVILVRTSDRHSAYFVGSVTAVLGTKMGRRLKNLFISVLSIHDAYSVKVISADSLPLSDKNKLSITQEKRIPK